jgi:hypothetical protein
MVVEGDDDISVSAATKGAPIGINRIKRGRDAKTPHSNQ